MIDVTNATIEKVARIIDPEAWESLEDGRDAHPDSLWATSRGVAREKAFEILKALSDPHPVLITAAVTGASTMLVVTDQFGNVLGSQPYAGVQQTTERR